MNKTEFTKTVAEKAGISKAEAKKTVEAVLDTVTESLKNGDKISLPGFGVFSTRETSARVGRNPATGESVNIAARRVAGFKAGAGLKDALNS